MKPDLTHTELPERSGSAMWDCRLRSLRRCQVGMQADSRSLAPINRTGRETLPAARMPRTQTEFTMLANPGNANLLIGVHNGSCYLTQYSDSLSLSDCETSASIMK